MVYKLNVFSLLYDVIICNVGATYFVIYLVVNTYFSFFYLKFVLQLVLTIKWYEIQDINNKLLINKKEKKMSD